MSIQNSLTGPVKRGDIATIRAHLSSFSNSEIKFLYTILGKATIELTKHDDALKKKLRNNLS